MSSNEGQVRGLPPFFYMFLILPGGIAQGFVGVTLSYLLRREGVSVAAIGGLVGLSLLPQTWRFLAGPVIDMSLSGRRWYLITLGVLLGCIAVLALSPLTPAGMPMLGAVTLVLGAACAMGGSACASVMAQTTPDSQRGAVAGWNNTGNLGGAGVGGGAGLWLAVHGGGIGVAAGVLALVCLASSLPIFWLRLPARAAGAGLPVQTRALARDIWALLRTRQGLLAAIVVTIPASLGAAANLFPAVAGDWGASADLVALVTGVLGGLATVPGCLLGGYLCDRFPRRIVYIWAALVIAAGEAAMAWAPHTPAWFAGMVLGGGLLLGVGYSAVSAVIFECLGPNAAATVSSALSSLANLPLVVMLAVLGGVQTRHGSTSMLLTEAGVAVVAAAGYAVLAYAWKPAARRGFSAELAGAEA